ncbi:hypothetical protein WAI453_000250 [Rhynchosporium graminicola]|uniref:Leucine-rich repeat-containing N-terminal plant-type domain-containing protein n=1 Tax=Rhynchosporium graminicola TaxID=2792576 RepID=A0A1E1JQ52_9HELO|nr:uncharacterized protein RCO7_00849 [Rhynchosporium commune]
MSPVPSLPWSFLALALCTSALAAPTVNNLARDLATVNAFKTRITHDPENALKTWVGSNVCTYEGFVCQKNPDNKNQVQLSSLDFNNFEFGGALGKPTHVVLTGFLEKLVDLSIIHLNDNQFVGTLPDTSGLPNLVELDASANYFSGTFPRTVFHNPNLKFLDLRFNQFTGPIPDQVFTTYKDIETLNLNDNHFSGPIPNSVGATQASFLSLANNPLSGPIPASLAQAPYLEEALLKNCGLSGTIPKQLGAGKLLRSIDASQNRLTGGVPEEVCVDTKAKDKFLDFSNNFLTVPLGPKCQALHASKGLIVTGNCIPGYWKQRPAAECKGH